MAITAVIVAAIFYFAFAWWNSDAQSYAAVTKLFKPPKLALTLVDGNRLAIRPSPADQALAPVQESWTASCPTTAT